MLQYNKLEGSVNRHSPFKKLSPKEIKLKNKPWLSAEIQKLIKIRNKVFARKKRQPNNESCKRLYNLLRNRVNREIKKSKKQYYADYFAANVNNIKKNMGWYPENSEHKENIYKNVAIEYWWENNC